MKRTLSEIENDVREKDGVEKREKKEEFRRSLASKR